MGYAAANFFLFTINFLKRKKETWHENMNNVLVKTTFLWCQINCFKTFTKVANYEGISHKYNERISFLIKGTTYIFRMYLVLHE